jgi:hypothetical protein
MNGNELNIFNFFATAMSARISVPTDFHGQVSAIKTLMNDDVSGLVDSLGDFAIESASVRYGIETESSSYTELLNNWLAKINSKIIGVPCGVNKLAEQYYRERWKLSSFPVLKMTNWQDFGQGIILPEKMFFVDGGSIYAKDKNSSDVNISLSNYDYYLGSEYKSALNKDIILTKPFASWYDKYPVPFLVKRGILHNWLVIKSLKNKQDEILEKVIPYLLYIQKGSEALELNNQTYDAPQLQEIVDQFDEILNEYKRRDGNVKSTTRAVNYDETLEQKLPDLKTMFNIDIFASSERSILSGWGMIDIIDSVSSSRKESVLNPKGYMEEVKKGVADFKQILLEAMYIIEEKNKVAHPKFISNKINITSSPITSFMTDKFKDNIRQCWERGAASYQTYVELGPELDFETEVRRIKKETTDGIKQTCYPNMTMNQEDKGTDVPGKPKEGIPESKTNPLEKQNFKSL